MKEVIKIRQFVEKDEYIIPDDIILSSDYLCKKVID